VLSQHHNSETTIHPLFELSRKEVKAAQKDGGDHYEPTQQVHNASNDSNTEQSDVQQNIEKQKKKQKQDRRQSKTSIAKP
jgi:hypothetical protein